MEHKETNTPKELAGISASQPKNNNERAILFAGILISLAILAHGYIVRGTTSSNSTGIVIDKAVVEAIKKEDVSHRYFADAKPTEQILFTEYSDTECPFCKQFHGTITEILKEGNGKYGWVYKHFPLSFHTFAQKEAESIECVRELAGDETAFRYIDLIFAVTPSNNKLPQDALYQIASEFKISKSKLKSCLDSNKYADRVKAQLKEGADSGVEGTPFTFVTKNENGTSTPLGVINGAQPKEAFEALLNK